MRWTLVPLLVGGVLASATVHNPQGWRRDRRLEAAVSSAGFNHCNILSIPNTRATDAFDPTIPSVILSNAAPDWIDRNWDRDVFLKAHGHAKAHVRLPAGQRQSGLLVRSSTINQFANEPTPREPGTEAGLMLSRTPQSVVDATDGLHSPAVLHGLNLTAPVLSMGASGVGLPFHNHGPAWLTVVAGKKLVVLAPPRRDEPSEAFMLLQHRPPISWAVGKPEQVQQTFTSAGLLTRDGTYPLHCILEPGDTVFIPCNWYHATLNIGDTLAFGGQQVTRQQDGSPSPSPSPSATASMDGCPADVDAQADTVFGTATTALTRVLESVDAAQGSRLETDLTKMLAIGEGLLQRCLMTMPLRVDVWIWRLRSALYQGALAPMKVTEQVIEQYRMAVKAKWIPELRAVSSLLSIADAIPSCPPGKLLLRTAFNIAAKGGKSVSKHNHRYFSASTGSTQKMYSDIQSELTDRLKARDEL